MYNIPDWCHHLLLTARMFVKTTLESYLDWYIGMKIEQVTQEHRLVGLIKLLEGKISIAKSGGLAHLPSYTPNGYIVPMEFCVNFFPRISAFSRSTKTHLNGMLLIETEFCKSIVPL